MIKAPKREGKTNSLQQHESLTHFLLGTMDELVSFEANDTFILNSLHRTILLSASIRTWDRSCSAHAKMEDKTRDPSFDTRSLIYWQNFKGQRTPKPKQWHGSNGQLVQLLLILKLNKKTLFPPPILRVPVIPFIEPGDRNFYHPLPKQCRSSSEFFYLGALCCPRYGAYYVQ